MPVWDCNACGRAYIHGRGHNCPVRLGSVRYKRNDEWIITNPGEPLYSAALFAAEEVYADPMRGWEKYDGEDDGRKENV